MRSGLYGFLGGTALGTVALNAAGQTVADIGFESVRRGATLVKVLPVLPPASDDELASFRDVHGSTRAAAE